MAIIALPPELSGSVVTKDASGWGPDMGVALEKGLHPMRGDL